MQFRRCCRILLSSILGHEKVEEKDENFTSNKYVISNPVISSRKKNLKVTINK